MGYRRYLGILLVSLSSMSARAQSSDIGDLSSFLFGITENIGEMMRIVCLITAAAMFLAALMKYKKYRSNPIEVKLSSVIVMVVTSLALAIVGMLPMYAGVSQY